MGEGTVGRRGFRTYYKGHMDKTKGAGRSKGGRWVWLGWWGEKCRQLYLNNNKIIKNK